METRKTKSGYKYREMIRVNGKAIKSPFFLRKTDAKAWKRQKELDKSSAMANGNSNSLVNANMTFREYTDVYMNSHVMPQLSKRTYISYESILRVHLLPTFGKSKLSQIQKSHVLKFIGALKERGHNGKGINVIIMLLRSIINHAIENEYMMVNPLKGIKSQKEDLKTDNYWTKAEIQQFLSSSINSTHYPLYFLALHTGLRLSELCGLKWDRIDFALSQITVTRTRDKTGLKETTKTKIKRILPMTKEVSSLLMRIYEYRSSEFVLIRPDGRPIDYGHVYRKLKIDQAKAKIERLISFHDLRHTFATQFMMNGGSVFELQKLLGHTNIDMTMRYAHFSPDHLQSSIKHMNMGVNPILNGDEPYMNPKNDKTKVHMISSPKLVVSP